MKFIGKSDLHLKKRNMFSHKGDNGYVLVVGGSIDYVGAVLLAGMAAYRSGADLVAIAAPEKVAWAINALSPDFITKKFPGTYFTERMAPRVIELSKKFDSILIGNGLGKVPTTRRFVQKIVEKIKQPKVIDADGIKAISAGKIRDSIITPHIRELEHFFINSKINPKEFQKINVTDYQEKAVFIKKSLARFLKNGNIVLLKGAVDIIASEKCIAYNRTGNPGMTVSGTGDVLAGLAAGILAQQKELFTSACAAAYINGRIGDRLLKKKGYGFVASDFIPLIQEEMRMLQR